MITILVLEAALALGEGLLKAFSVVVVGETGDWRPAVDNV